MAENGDIEFFEGGYLPLTAYPKPTSNKIPYAGHLVKIMPEEFLSAIENLKKLNERGYKEVVVSGGFAWQMYADEPLVKELIRVAKTTGTRVYYEGDGAIIGELVFIAEHGKRE